MLSGSVGSYQVWGRLSQGGMCDVWLARHEHLALPVVVKTMKTGVSSQEDRWQRLLQEARLAARLTSPRVVRVIDVGVQRADAGDVPYLVEEYVDGLDLAELDKRRRQALRRALPLWLVCDVAAQAAEGLHVAHQNGVIHRDVKPQNVFGTGHAQVKVGDFGVATTVHADEALPAGTPLYMAPEQLAGDRVDRRADVYGLGATVFALRYGAPPFGPLDLRRPDRVAAFPAARGPEEAYFQHVVARMLAYRPEERYPHLATAGRHLASIARATRPRATPARVSTFEFHFLGTRILFDVGDIAEVDGVDAVVSSANHKMTMRTGGGDALRRRGGDAIEVEAMQGGERALGDCVLTTAGSLALRGIVHAVAAWNEVSTVARATQRALLLAEEHGFRRLAVPALGSGQGRVALEACADAMVATLAAHLSLGGSRLEEVRFVLVDEAARARVLEVAAGILLGGGDGLAGHEDDAATVTTSDSFASTLFGSSTK